MKGLEFIIAILVLTITVVCVLTGCDEVTEMTATQHLSKGYQLLEKGFYDKAIDQFTEAIQLDDTMAEAYAYRAVAYNEKRRWNLAIADCTDAIEFDSDLDIAYRMRAIACMEMGDTDCAIDDFSVLMTITDNEDWIEEAKAAIAELSE